MKRTRFVEEKSSKKRISIASGKAKGRELQKWMCQKISDYTGYPWGKDQPIESRPMGQSGVDVRLSPEVLKLFPMSVECKRQENWAVPSWIEQAKTNQLRSTYWFLVMRRNREDPVVAIDGNAFFELLERLKKCGGSLRLE